MAKINISKSEASKIIDKAKERIKSHDAVKDAFDKHGIDIDEVDDVVICFSDLDVSARTDHGIIYLNWALLDEGFPENDHYLAHELTHFAQQTTGDGPTEGSTDDTYLDNKYEQEGFQVQTEYLSETKGDDVAESYIDNVLKYHEVPKSERAEKKKELLQLASNQLKLKEPSINKTQKELLHEYDEAIERGPQVRHHRMDRLRSMIPPNQKTYVIQQLKELLKKIDENKDNAELQRQLQRKKKILQLSLGFDE
jgi:hypothetical protein